MNTRLDSQRKVKGEVMADFEERHLKISFGELNTKLNDCIQKILDASFMENKDSVLTVPAMGVIKNLLNL